MDAQNMALTEVKFLPPFSVVATKQAVNPARRKAAMAARAVVSARQPVIIVNSR
jgi:hypothetical protein